jgi:hypothetical protein
MALRPRLTREAIDQLFEEVKPLVDHSLATSAPPDMATSRADLLDSARRIAQSLQEYLATHQEFAARFDFGWAATPPRPEDEPFDVLVQSAVVTALAEVDPKHPNLDRLKPVAVKWVENPNFVAVSVPGATVDFICLSRGFAKFVQAVVGAFVAAHDAGREAPPIEGLIAKTNYIGGHDLERLLRTERQDGITLMGKLVDVGWRIASGDQATWNPSISPRLNGDIRTQLPFLGQMLLAADVFVALHELAHLLEGHRSSERSLDHEIAADRGAISLGIIVSARLEGARFTSLLGPTCLLQTARLYELIRRARSAFEKDWSAAALYPEEELAARLAATRRAAGEFGLGSLLPVALAVEAEMSAMILGCQCYLLSQLGSEVAFEELLHQ